MPPDSDDQLGNELDQYLSALESGDNSLLTAGASESEVAQLKSVVTELHQLAQMVEQSPGGMLLAGRGTDRTIGKYQLTRFLGRGGQSATWLAEDPDLQRLVVLKMYHDTGNRREKVLREGRALAKVSSPYVAQCYGSDCHDGCPFLVLEYVPGTPLDKYAMGRRLGPTKSARLISAIAEGLAKVHAREIVHQDIKPANIIVGDHGRPRVVDFGLAQTVTTVGNATSGTPAYMAPEQARGEADRIGIHTDVFGLGSVLYELLTGRPPFAAETKEESLAAAREGEVIAPKALNRMVPNRLNSICMQCLAKEPADRFSSMRELVQTLRWWRYQSAAWRAAPTAAILATLAVGSFWWQSSRPVSPTGGPSRPVIRGGPVSFTGLTQEAKKVFGIGERLRQDFRFDVEIIGGQTDDHGTVRLAEGKSISFRLSSERDCYVTILSHGPDETVQLFPRLPYETTEHSLLRSGVVTEFPSHHAPISTVVSRGPEAICVIASTHPVSLVDAAQPSLVFRSDQQTILASRLRGLVREPAGSGQLISQVVFPYQVDP